MDKLNKESVKSWIIVILLIIVAIGAWCVVKPRVSTEALKQRAENFVQVAGIEPTAQNISVSRDYIGRVEAINSVDIVPYLSGYISKITATGGQDVKKDDILIVLRREEHEAAVTSAYAGLLAADADFSNAKVQFDRFTKAGPKAVSATELDNAKTTMQTAAATVKQAEANFQTAQINLDYTLVKAPFDGTLGNIAASVGDFITPSSQNLVKIVQYNPIRVVFSLSDKEFLFNQHLLADKVKLELANGKIYDRLGKITYTANEIEPTTNTLAIYAEFANPDKILVPNAYVKVLLERQYKNVVLLAKNLVQLKEDGSYVYTITNGVITITPVTVITEQGDNYVIENTFAAGDIVITDNLEPNQVGQKAEMKNISTKEE